MSNQARIPSGKVLRAHHRGTGPTPLPGEASMFSSEASWSEDDDVPNYFEVQRRAMHATHDAIQRQIKRMQRDSARLRRELLLLHRHVRVFNHPMYETWEADILTRLIEVAHAHQRRKLPQGVAIGEATVAHRENLSLAYANAVNQIHPSTLQQLGLSEKYHTALQRYNEVSVYRSPNPFQTEGAFARWLVQEKHLRAEKFEFWSKLFPICYGRTLEESADIC